MPDQHKTGYKKVHDKLEEHLNPEGYTIGDVVLQRVKWIAILLTIGLVYNGIAWLFKKPEPHLESNAQTSSEAIVVPRFEKKEYDPNYTDKIVSDLKSKLPIKSISGKLKVISISHEDRTIRLGVVSENAHLSQNLQVMRYYCETGLFTPFIEQNLYTHITVMNENNSVVFETGIQDMADCP